MRLNIVRDVFMRDLKRIMHNWVAVVVVLGICVLPSLYAWFNIGANMDPYANTGNIKVGVVCNDIGATSKQTGDINIGEMVVENLEKNDSIGWTFVSEKEADKGIRSGRFYATIVIPKTFSADMLSFLDGSVGKPELTYYVNEKKNAIAPKVTGTAASAVQRQINESFMEVLSETVAEALMDFAGEANSELQLSGTDAINNLKAVSSNLASYRSNITTAHATIKENKVLLSDARVSLKGAQQKNKDLEAFLEENDPTGRFLSMSQTLGPELVRLMVMVDSFDRGLTSLDKALTSSDAAIAIAQLQVNSLQKEIAALVSSDFVKELAAINGMDPDEIADFMKSPIEVEEKCMYSVRNYGSGMAPFYTMLALWVGGIVLLAVFKLEVDKEGVDPSIRPSEAYLGRWLLFVVFAVIQGLICCIGDILLLGIQCRHPLLFVIVGIEASIAFASLIYALATAFRHIGKGLVLLLVILQIPGSSGTYPIEMTGSFFRMIHPLLPFSYGITAMREAIAGTYGTIYIKNLAELGLFFVFAMFIGLVLRYTVLNFNRMIDIELGKTGLIETETVGEEYPYDRIRRVIDLLRRDKAVAERLDERRERFEANYELRAHQAISCLIVVPIFLLILMFTATHKMLVLCIWIVTLIGMCAACLAMEYKHRKYQDMSGGEEDA